MTLKMSILIMSMENLALYNILKDTDSLSPTHMTYQDKVPRYLNRQHKLKFHEL